MSCLEVHTYEPMGIPVAGTMQTTIHQHLELIDYERENYMDYSFRRGKLNAAYYAHCQAHDPAEVSMRTEPRPT